MQVIPFVFWRIKRYVFGNKVECAASLFGAIGSLVLSLNGEGAKYAWIIFLVSNSLFVAMALRKRLLGFLVLQGYFSITSVVGIANYF